MIWLISLQAATRAEVEVLPVINMDPQEETVMEEGGGQQQHQGAEDQEKTQMRHTAPNGGSEGSSG